MGMHGGDTMSVSLLVFKGKEFDPFKSQEIAEIPVSFQNIWDETWEKAISACEIKIFVCCGMFSINAVPSVLTELDSIFDWVNHHGGKDREYVQRRIKELKDFLNRYYNEYGNADYWFDLG